MSKVNVSVSVSDAALSDIGEVVKRVKSTGMHVDRVLHQSGILTGSVEAEDIDRLSQVAGVSSVEPERSFQIPPPDSDLQ